VLTKLADPRMAGYIAVNKLLVCSKFVMKVNPDEKVGLHAAVDGKPSVVEYSEIPDDKKK
jgi:UDP-N-acetylglucosamine/UDP-N-acetylgalactosamine diphosphorylase